MKKIIAMLLALCMMMALAACQTDKNPTEPSQGTTTEPTQATTEATQPTTEATEPSTEPAPKVMTYAEYDAAAMDSQVIIEAYVQAHQSWWDNKITVYAQDKDGAYFLYEMACSEADAAKLVPGTKIRVTGYKGAWAGEVEVMDATFEFVEGADTYIAEPIDGTALLASADLIKYQNQLAAFKGMTVKAIEYKNGEPGDDIYLTLTLNGADYSFCVERYLTDPESEVYKTVGTLKVGDVVDVEGFIYWYEGVNPHITAISLAG